MRELLQRRVPALALAALASLVATGCGGDETSGATTASSALSADRWRQEVDAICADIHRRGELVAQEQDDTYRYAKAIRGLGREYTIRLKARVAPPELDEERARMVANQEELQAVLERAVERMDAQEDPDAVLEDLVPDIERLALAGDRLAKEAGLTDCAGNAPG